jgi:hypothetical protein
MAAFCGAALPVTRMLREPTPNLFKAGEPARHRPAAMPAAI